MITSKKYKFRYADDDCKGGVSQQDIYQIVIYCYKRYLQKGLLLYPCHSDKGANNEQHSFQIHSGFGNMQIDACSIDITETDFDNFEAGQKARFNQIF